MTVLKRYVPIYVYDFCISFISAWQAQMYVGYV